MKLSEFLFNKLMDEVQPPPANMVKTLGRVIGGFPRVPTVKEIEEWIVEWYMSEFTQIGCGKSNIPRAPPSWLANWRKNE